MNTILVIGIACAVACMLGYHLGVGRGRKEGRRGEYFRGFRMGYDQAKKELTERLRMEDDDPVVRIGDLRGKAGN